MLIELFSLCVMAEALQANTNWKNAQLKGVGQLRRNFYIAGDVHCKPFLHG